MENELIVIVKDALDGYHWRCNLGNGTKEHVRESDGFVLSTKRMNAMEMARLKRKRTESLSEGASVDEEASPHAKAGKKPSECLLRLIGPNGQKNKHGSNLYDFQCECGNIVSLVKSYVAGGKIKSCGCLKPGKKPAKPKTKTSREKITRIAPTESKPVESTAKAVSTAAPRKKRTKARKPTRRVKAETKPTPPPQLPCQPEPEEPRSVVVQSQRRDLRALAASVEGLTLMVMGITVGELEALCEGLAREEQQASERIVGKPTDYSAYRRLSERWLAFRKELESLAAGAA